MTDYKLKPIVTIRCADFSHGSHRLGYRSADLNRGLRRVMLGFIHKGLISQRDRITIMEVYQ